MTDRWASEPDRQGQGRRYVAVWRDERRRQRKRSFHRKGDAVRFLRETERSLDLGLFADPRAAEVGFAEYATNWLSRAEHLRAKTVADYDSILRNHLIPALGAIPLRRMRPQHAADLIGRLQGHGLASSTVNKVVRVASTILNAAVAEQRLQLNPFSHVKRPSETTRELRILTPGELSSMLSCIDEHYRCLVLSAAVLGLRFGELAGLHPSNLDIANRRVLVVEQLTKGPQGPVRGPLKTKASQRSVAVPSQLIPELQRQLENRSSAEFVFTSKQGGPIRHSNFLRRHWAPAVASAGLGHVRFHDLRHASAAWAISVGAPATLIQKRLGHASIVTTLQVYGHLLPGIDEQVAARLNDAVNEALVPQVFPEQGSSTDPSPDVGGDMGDVLRFPGWARRDLNPRPPPCKPDRMITLTCGFLRYACSEQVLGIRH